MEVVFESVMMEDAKSNELLFWMPPFLAEAGTKRNATESRAQLCTRLAQLVAVARTDLIRTNQD